MLYVLHHVLALAVAGWLLYVSGWWLERRFFKVDASLEARAERFFARWTLGLAAWIATLLVLAALGLYAAVPILAVAASWQVAALVELRSGLRRPREDSSVRDRSTLRSTTRTWRSLPGPLLLLVFGLGLLGPVFCLAINPTVSWDASAYHLTLPRLYLEHGGFRDVPMNVYSRWPQGLELLFGAAMALDSYVLAKALHFGTGLLVLAGLARLLGGGAALVAMGLFALNGVVLFEMRSAYVDLAHAFALLAAVVLASRAAEAPPGEHRRAVFLAGAAAGVVAALKVTGVVSAAIIALLLLPRWLRDAGRSGVRRALGGAAAFAAPVLLLWLPWLIKTGLETGNPFYPFLWTLFGGPDWSAELARQLSEWQRSIGMGRGLIDYLLLPLRVVLLGGRGYDHFDGEIGTFWLFAAPAAAWAAWRATSWRAASWPATSKTAGVDPGVEGAEESPRPDALLLRRLGIVGGLHFLFWTASSQQIRFLIPVLAVLAVPAASAAMHAAGRLTSRTGAGSLGRRVLEVSLVLLLVLGAADWALRHHGKVLEAGWQHARLYARPGFDPRAVSPAPEIFEAVGRLPENALLLMINTNQGFFCPRDYLADSFFEASQISDWLAPAAGPDEVGALLRGRGVSHVLIDRRARGVAYPRPLLDLLSDARLAPPVADDGRFLLLALR